MATKEIYRIGIQVGVDGVEESKQKLSAMEKYTQQAEKRLKMLNKITASPTAKLKDQTSSAIDKINVRSKSLSRAVVSPTAKINDQATSKLDRISTTIKRLENSNITATLRINDQTDSYLNKVQAKSDRLKNTNINPTAKVSTQSSPDFNKTKSELMELDGEFRTANMSATKYFNTIQENSKKADDSVSNNLSNMGKKFSDAGEHISQIGDKLTTRVTLPIVGIGVAAGKIGMDFESQMSRVKAISGATGEEFKKLHDQALQLGADTAFSSKQASEGMENLASAGFSTDEIISAMPGLLNLAASSGESLASSSDIAASTLRGFGLAADQAGHVADVLAKNAGATNAAVADTGEAMKYIAPVSHAMGLSLEEVTAAIGEMSNSGIKGSQAGTTLRSALTRLASPSKEAAGAMASIGFNAFDSKGKLKSLSTIVGEYSKALKGKTEQQQQDLTATIFGQEAMSGMMVLMQGGASALDELTNSYKNADGAAEEMAKTMQDNSKSAIEQMMGSLETAAIKVEEAFAPLITSIANKVQDLANKFSELTPEQQMFYAKLLAGVALLGPATKLIGGLTKTVGTLIKVSGAVKSLFDGAKIVSETAEVANGVSKMGLAAKLLPALFSPAGIAIAASVSFIGAAIVAESNLMKKSITTTTEELGPMEKVINALNGHLNKSKKEMVDLNLIYDDFGEGVSDSFKKGAQDASKSLLKLEMNINRFTIDDKFDDSENNQLKNWVNDMAYEGINAIKEKKTQIKSELSKTFSLDGVTSASEQGTLDYMDKFFGEGVNKELEIRDQMYAIGDKAIKEHGKLLEDDIKQLKEKAAELQEIKLEYANADNAGERAYARSKFTSSAERVTGIDGASELLQERAKEHQKSVDEAKANYDKTIATTQYHLDNDKNLSSEDRNTLETQLKETTAARDKALKQAEEDWKSDLKTLYQAYPKAKGKLNEETGAKFNDGEIKSQGTMDNIINSHSGLSDITKSGVYALRNNTTKDLETLYVSVDETTKQIKGIFNGSNGDIGAYSDAQKEKLIELQGEYSNTGAAMQELTSAHAILNTNTGEVINSTGNLMGKLQGVQTAADGTVTEILNLNGTPIQITSNASGEITNMEVFKGSMDDIPPSKDVKINDNANQATSDMNGTTNAINGMPEKKTVTITTIFKKITQWFEEKFSDSSYTHTDQDTYDENRTRLGGDGYAVGTNNAAPGIHPVAEKGFEIVFGQQTRLFRGGEKVLTHERSKSLLQNLLGSSDVDNVNKIKSGYAEGTNNAEPGIHPVAENGFEIIFGQQKKLFKDKEKILTNKPSKLFSQNLRTDEQFQVQQGQFQLVQPHGKLVTVNVGDIPISVNGNQDNDGIVQEVIQKVGVKLKEALENIKK